MALTFATRPSTLARWQTQWVMEALQQAWPGLECREVVITTQGDRILDRPLPEIGGKGLFTQELETCLLDRQVQVAVHSLKDLPIEASPGLSIGAIPPRWDPRDVLVSHLGFTLESLPEGAIIGTSSLRRSAQLLAHQPGLRIADLRGNVDTRLRKSTQGDFDAIVLAGAGLQRLGMQDYITQWLPLEVMLPAPGQGALAVQCRADDTETLRLLAAIESPPARSATLAERAFLSALGGGCSLPIAAFGTQVGEVVDLQGLVASRDGSHLIRVNSSSRHPEQLGEHLARQALAQGAGEVLNV